MQNNIYIDTKTRNIKSREHNFLGIAGEHEIEQIVFKLSAFIVGEAILEIQKYNKENKQEKYFINLEKQEESYIFNVKNSLLDVAKPIKMQLHITTANEEVFKSKIFEMQVYEAIDATETIPEEYAEWIDIANSAIAQMHELEQTISAKEEERQEAETNRTNSEKIRNESEKDRLQKEEERKEAEQERIEKEKTRIKNESDRITNENGRAEAENNRSNAEISRNNAETQRQSNETARQTAEDAREDYIITLRQSIENGDFDGATFIPHLDENGDLSWSNNKELDNPPTINIMGPRGPQGETGPKPVAGTDYYTQEEKEDFAAQVIAESKTEIDNFTSDKKDEITDLATDKLNELFAVNTLKIISEEVIDL